MQRFQCTHQSSYSTILNRRVCRRRPLRVQTSVTTASRSLSPCMRLTALRRNVLPEHMRFILNGYVVKMMNASGGMSSSDTIAGARG